MAKAATDAINRNLVIVKFPANGAREAIAAFAKNRLITA
jgi:hypothetical protein